MIKKRLFNLVFLIFFNIIIRGDDMDFDLLKELLIISMTASVIITNVVQKIKESCIKSSCACILVSFVVSMILGTLFAYTFANVSLIKSLWVGIFSFIGADVLYKTFEDKIFSSFTNISSKNEETQHIGE